MKRKMNRTLLAALLVVITTVGCIGPFNATSRVHTWNREFDNRWAGEAVFIVFRVAFVYTATFVGDILIFNSMEFWGFDNPIDPPSKERLKALKAADDARATK